MSTIVVVYNNNNQFSKEIKNYLHKGFDVQIWGEQNIPGTSSMSLPSSRKYTEYAKIAQEKINTFFRHSLQEEASDIYRQDYIKKTFDLIFMDFVAFMKAASDIQKKSKCIVLAPPYLSRIYYNNQVTKNSDVLLGIPGIMFRLILTTIKFSIHTLRTKEKIKTPTILYLRKKVFPDFSMSKVLKKGLKKKNISFSATYMLFGKESNKFGINFLNAYNGMLKNILFSFFYCLEIWVID